MMYFYRLAAFAAFALSLHAQTTVTGPVVDTTGATWGGKITLRPTSVVCPTGVLGPSLKTITVTSGVFSQVLCPGIYSVRYQGVNASRSAYWTVPDTGPVIIKEIESGAMPTPLIQFSYSLISGLAPGDLLYGSAVGMARLPAPANGAYSIQWTNGVPSYVAGGGGGGGTWGTITGILSSQNDLQTALSSKQSVITNAPGAWPSFATVATSGSYADLSNKPVLGSAALLSIGTTAGTVAAGDDTRIGGCLSGTLTWSQIASGICDTVTGGGTGTIITGAPATWPSFALVATSGNYVDLSNKPTIPAAQISSDWNAVSGLAQISNKPALGGAALLNIGTTTGTVAAGDDARLANARVPTAHAASHATGGGDAITPASIGALPALSTDQATPAAPGAGQTKIYTKAGKACSVDPSGVETCMGGGGGGLPAVTISTSGPVSVVAVGFYFNNASGALTFNLPTGAIGSQFCFRNYAAKVGTITIQAPTATYIDKDGTNGTVAGSLVSAGALADYACVVATSTTQYVATIVSGGWTNN